jgi:hypothetical protein
MLDVDTFLTALYVIRGRLLPVPSAKKAARPKGFSLRKRDPYPRHLLARFCRFTSERDFYRYAKSSLRDAFPTLPDRSQFNRCVRSHAGLIEEMAQAPEALGGEQPPDRGEGLREAPQCLWPSHTTSPRASGFAGAPGGQGCAAQLLHLAQRATRSSSADLR